MIQFVFPAEMMLISCEAGWGPREPSSSRHHKEGPSLLLLHHLLLPGYLLKNAEKISSRILLPFQTSELRLFDRRDGQHRGKNSSLAWWLAVMEVWVYVVFPWMVKKVGRDKGRSGIMVGVMNRRRRIRRFEFNAWWFGFGGDF